VTTGSYQEQESKQSVPKFHITNRAYLRTQMKMQQRGREKNRDMILK